MRILAIDYGTKRIGVAASDPLGITSQGLPTVMNLGKEKVLASLKAICKEYEVSEIVVGLPVNMDGTHGPKAKEVLEIVVEWEKALNIPVKTWDERLTSREATRLMTEEGLSSRKQKENSDRLAATMILQNYLNAKRISRRDS